MTGHAFTDLSRVPPSKYGVIVADPPWRYVARTEAGYSKAPQAHYDCLSTADLAGLPVRSWGARDCALVLWAVGFALDQAVDLMRAWGFRYVTAGTWAKTAAGGEKWAFGSGHVLRGAAEFFLIGAKGAPKRQWAGQRNVIGAARPGHAIDAAAWADADLAAAAGDLLAIDARREHSRKPDSVHRAIERLFPGPYLELFSREARGPGWDAAGDEAGKFDGGGR